MKKTIFLLSVFWILIVACSKTGNDAGVISFSPDAGAVGSIISISGKNFGSSVSALVVYFDGIAATPLTVMDTLISVQVPAGATTGKISVSIGGKHMTSHSAFTILPGTWTRKADLPFLAGRVYGAGFSIGNKGYYAGGSDNPTYYNDLYEYDPATDQWTQKAFFPGSPFLGPVCFVINGKAYLGNFDDPGGLSNEFWEYDPATNKWTLKADFPGPRRSISPNFSIGNQGFVGNTNPAVNDFWMYDQPGNSWIQKANPPPGVDTYFSSSFTIGNKGYTGLGGDSFQEFWEYDPAQDSWKRKADFPVAAGSLAGATLNNLGYFLGSQEFSFLYNQQSDSWTRVGFYAERYSGVSFTIGQKIYYATGGNGKEGLSNQFWEFTP